MVSGGQAREHDGVSDAGTDFFVDGERERLQERGLADEHEVVRTREVLTKQTQFTEAVRGHEMGVVHDDDG